MCLTRSFEFMQLNQNVFLYNMRIMKFFRMVPIIHNRQFVIMHPGAERIWDIFLLAEAVDATHDAHWTISE